MHVAARRLLIPRRLEKSRFQRKVELEYPTVRIYAQEVRGSLIMSQEAYNLFDRALSEQHARNEARRIRIRVHEARGNPHSASFRWPFELLQNALDAGPRAGSGITVRLNCEDSKLTFEHDGAPFTSEELAALLSGGSSKEFESETTTGRFGTGFLVTHVLAEQTTLRGLLKVPHGYELFELVLDRGGDEDAILRNSRFCNDAIRLAKPITKFDGVPSASFEYRLGDDRTLLIGVEALKRSPPYLYVTRLSLGQVQFTDADGSTEVWTPSEIIEEILEDGFAQHRTIEVERDGNACASRRVYRFAKAEDSAAAALVLIEESEDGWEVLLPEDEAPRVYREYPLRGSSFVPVNFVFDGKFDPDQERNKLLMSDEDKALLEDAFAAGVIAVKHAFGEGWIDAHLLALASTPTTAFDPTNAEEKAWWAKQLAAFAQALAALPIVDCTSQSLPAISEGFCADFVIPRLLANSTTDETTIARLWPLVTRCTELLPPRNELAVEWTEIAEGWHSLGLDISRITVSSLAKWVRDDANELEELHLEGDKAEWLSKFLDVVGECWSKRTGVDLSVLEGLIPDQNRHLRGPSELHRDIGVSAALKDICKGIGYDVRGKLLLSDIEEMTTEKDLQFLRDVLRQACPASLSEAQVVDEAVKHLGDGLPENEHCDDETAELRDGVVLLFDYLWQSQGIGATAVAKKLPLIASNGTAVRWGHDRMMMAPVCSWHVSAQPFAEAYPLHRVLAKFFAGGGDKGLPNIVTPLVEFGIAIADPITSDTPAELRDRRLDAISPDNTEDTVVTGQRFSQIALLQPEVLNRCQEGIDEARALFGLVLCHVAPHDPEWREQRTVKARKLRQEVQLSVCGALWLADLKFRSWVPIPGDDGKPAKMRADAKTLGDLLDPAWLENNDPAIRLLSEWFEFDELELRLLGLAPDPEKRRELRSSIAKLVESGGADPGFYSSLTDYIEQQRRKSRDIERCKSLGIAVQKAVKAALDGYGLNLKLIDYGFDYEVSDATDDLMADASTKFEVGSYLLEIKATTIGQARLTPTQAETASAEATRYVLCVVDLRDVPEDELDGEWTTDRIEELARINSDIGDSVKETCELVEVARTNSIGIRNDAALRYEVPESVWEDGASISDWVSQIRQMRRQTS